MLLGSIQKILAYISSVFSCLQLSKFKEIPLRIINLNLIDFLCRKGNRELVLYSCLWKPHHLFKRLLSQLSYVFERFVFIV